MGIKNVKVGQHKITFERGDQKLSGNYTIEPDEILKLKADFKKGKILNISAIEKAERDQENETRRLQEERQRKEETARLEREQVADEIRRKEEDKRRAEEIKKTWGLLDLSYNIKGQPQLIKGHYCYYTAKFNFYIDDYVISERGDLSDESRNILNDKHGQIYGLIAETENNRKKVYLRLRGGSDDKCRPITGDRTGKTALYVKEENIAVNISYGLMNRSGFLFNYKDEYIYEINVYAGNYGRREPPYIVAIKGGHKTSIEITIDFDRGTHNIAKTSRAMSVDEIESLVQAAR
jgi:hypothetical protein